MRSTCSEFAHAPTSPAPRGWRTSLVLPSRTHSPRAAGTLGNTCGRRRAAGGPCRRPARCVGGGMCVCRSELLAVCVQQRDSCKYVGGSTAVIVRSEHGGAVLTTHYPRRRRHDINAAFITLINGIAALFTLINGGAVGVARRRTSDSAQCARICRQYCVCRQRRALYHESQVQLATLAAGLGNWQKCHVPHSWHSCAAREVETDERVVP